MVRAQLVTQVSWLLLALCLSSVSAYEQSPVKKPIAKLSTEVVVEGVVYCQSCRRVGTNSLTDAKTLPSARVSVTCKNRKNKVSFYKTYEADKSGYFYAELEGYEMTSLYADHPLQACKVKLVASPDPKCNVLTNVNQGMNGATLRYNGKTFVNHKYNYKAIIYAAGPLAFRPDHCTHY